MMHRLIILALLSVSLTGFSQVNYKVYDPADATRLDMLNDKAFAEIQIPDTSGELFHTSSLLGKTVYVDFWFTECAPCLREIPYLKALHEFYKDSSNLEFVSICIENKERKEAWKQLVRERQLPGIQLFYERNSPQKINLLREYKVFFPTYVLVNTDMRVVGYDVPRPSETTWVQWAIAEALKGKYLSEAYRSMANRAADYMNFVKENGERITALKPAL